MNNIQLYLSIGVPTLTVILARVLNSADNNRLNDKVGGLAESMRAETTAMRNDHYEDNLALMGCMVPLHEWMAKLEPRNEGLI